MTIVHHPDPDLLLSYAAGATREGLSLVIATHLAFCAACRRVVEVAEEAGGELLGKVEPSPLASDAFEKLVGRLDEGPQIARETVRGNIPAPLRAYVGPNLSDIRWQMVAPGIYQRPLLKQGKTRARLLKVDGGVGVGRHTHRGEEMTLVLTGGFSDETGSYGPGDVQMATPEMLHLPVSDPGAACISLAVTDAPLRFLRKRDALIGWIFGF